MRILLLLFLVACSSKTKPKEPIIDVYIYDAVEDRFCLDHELEIDCLNKEQLDGFIVIPPPLFFFMLEEIAESRDLM